MNTGIYKKAIALMQGRGLDVGVARVAIVTPTGVEHSGSTNCFAMLNSFGYKKPDKVAILSCIMNGGETEEAFIPYINWLIKRSPYTKAFLSKGAAKVAKDRCIIINPNCPSNIMLGGMIAVRGVSEYKYIARAWLELKNRGVNENLAFILAHHANFGRAGTVGFLKKSTNHAAVHSYKIDKDYVKAFITNNPVHVLEEYQTSNRYSRINDTWGVQVPIGECYLNPFFAKIIYTKEKTNNVFACALPNADDKTTSIDNGFNQLAAVAKEIMKDIE